MKPLQGIRVLDFTRILAGPFSTMLLSDMGAEIIKIEEPEKGDETRSYGPPFFEGTSTYFMSVNRGKKSLTLNLKHPKVKGILTSLIQASDVVIENFRPGTAAEFGLDYARLSAIHPRLIFCSISGYGETGPLADAPGYDLVVQGMSGLMDLTGEKDALPSKVGTSIGDLVAGLYAVQAILLAILERQKTGKGEFLDISLLDCLTSMLTYQASRSFVGESPKRMGNDHPSICPYETFQAKDGYLNVAVANDRLWSGFCRATGLDALVDDPQFRTNPDRVKNRTRLQKVLEETFRQKSVKEWLQVFKESGIPAGPILSVTQSLQHPQTVARGMVNDLPLNGKTFKFLANPIPSLHQELSTLLPPPSLGAHSDEILQAVLGLLPAEVELLRRDGVI